MKGTLQYVSLHKDHSTISHEQFMITGDVRLQGNTKCNIKIPAAAE